MAAIKSLAKLGMVLMVLFSLACVWVRVAYPSWIPFIADEPLFQMILDDYLAAGKFPIVSMRGSSIPLAYGAGAMWIYSILRVFFSSLEGMAFFHGVVYTLGLASVAIVLKGRTKASNVLLITWLSLSAPILFFFSRLLWDNTFFVPFSGMMIALIDHLDRRNPGSLAAWLGIAFLGAFMLNIHLMVAPVLLAAGIVSLIILKRADLPVKRKWQLGCFSAGLFLVLVAPYLYEGVRLYYAEGVAEKTRDRTLWGDSRNVWWLLQRAFVYLSYWKAHDQFGAAFPDFLEFSGSFFGKLFRRDILGWVLKAVALGYMVALAVRAMKRKRLDAVQWMLLLSLVLTIFFFNLINIPTEAHYFHGMWWFGFFAVACALEELPRQWGKGYKWVVVACALLNTAYIVHSMRYILVNDGIRNYTFGSTMHDVRSRLSEVCQDSASPAVPIYLEGVFLLPHPVRYFNGHLPECRGKLLTLVPNHTPDAWVLRYRHPNPSAALEWVKPGRAN